MSPEASSAGIHRLVCAAAGRERVRSTGMSRFPAGRRSHWRRRRSDRFSPPLSAAREARQPERRGARTHQEEATGEQPAPPSAEAGVPASSRPPKTPPTLGSGTRVKVLRSDAELVEARTRAAEQLQRISEAMGPAVRRAQSQIEAARSATAPDPSMAGSGHGGEAGEPGEDSRAGDRSDRASSQGQIR